MNITVVVGGAQGSNSSRNNPQGQGAGLALGSGFVYDAQGQPIVEELKQAA